MTRALVRPLLAVLVALAVTVLAVPSADAHPLETSGTEIDTSWLDTALAFFGTLLAGDEVGLVTLFMAGNGNDNGNGNGNDDGDGTIQTVRPRPNEETTNTGSCIDPWGMPTSCAY